LIPNRYAVSAFLKPKLVRPIVASKLDLPGEDHKPIDIGEVLGFPWCDLLRESHAHLLLTPAAGVIKPYIRPFGLFASSSERCKTYERLHRASMLEFLPASSFEPEVVIDLFGVDKKGISIRMISDMRPANLHFVGRVGLQKAYEQVLATRGGHLACGLPAKVFELFNPGDFDNLPSTAVSKYTSDLSNFFHFFRLPKWMWKYQALPRLRSSALNLDVNVYGEWVYPTLTSLPMGHTLACVLTQTYHQQLVVPLLDRCVYFKTPSPCWARGLDNLRACAGAGGCVDLTLVPDHMRALVDPSGSATLVGGQVPLGLFELEPTVSHRADFTAKGWDLRQGRRIDTSDDAPGMIHIPYFIFIDDHHAFGCNHDVDSTVTATVLNWILLRCMSEYRAAGLQVKSSKVAWAHSEPTLSLGYVVDLTGTVPIFFPPIRKAAKLLRQTRSLVQVCRACPRLTVSVAYLLHLIGGLVWASLCRRPLLSIFYHLFQAVGGRDPSAKISLKPKAIDELEWIADVVPLMFGRAAPAAGLVATFDASGGSRRRKAGYGVALKDGCTGAVLSDLIERVERVRSWSKFSLTESGEVDLRLRPLSAATRSVSTAKWLRCSWAGDRNGWWAARSGAFNTDPRIITLGETYAGLMALREFASRPSITFGRKVVMIGDNQPSLGILSKGRSGVFDLNMAARKAAAVVLAGELWPRYVWVRSECNPADGPSRWVCKSHSVLGGWIEDLTIFGCVEKKPGPSRFKGPILRPPSAGQAPSGMWGLVFSGVKVETACQYLRAFLGFKEWFRLYGVFLDVSWAQLLAEYVYFCFESEEATQQQCRNFLACLSKLEPQSKHSGELQLAQTVIRGWRKLKPPKSYLPVPKAFLVAMAVQSVLDGRVLAGVAMLLAFEGYLRSSEVLALTPGDVAFQGDPRLIVPGKGAVFLRKPKSGRPQWVEIRDVLVVDLLRVVVADCQHSTTLFGLSSASFLRLFVKAQVKLGLHDAPFRVHSCRHGGATHDFLTKALGLPEIMRRGRWSGMKTTLIYVQESQARVLSLRVSSSTRARVAKFNKHARVLFGLGVA
jgi:hypothetical protein